MLGDYDVNGLYAAYGEYIKLALDNFTLFMFAIAVFFILLHKLIVRRSISEYEIVYRWLALFPLGGTLIYAFAMHMFYPAVADAGIGWSYSPFGYEVAMADLAFGLLAIFSFNASLGFRIATVIGCSIYMFGIAYSQIYLMIINNHFNPGTIASWIWMTNLILPLLMLMCVNGLYRNRVA